MRILTWITDAVGVLLAVKCPICKTTNIKEGKSVMIPDDGFTFSISYVHTSTRITSYRCCEPGCGCIFIKGCL